MTDKSARCILLPCVIIISAVFVVAVGYRPVIIVHGLFDGPKQFINLTSFITKVSSLFNYFILLWLSGLVFRARHSILVFYRHVHVSFGIMPHRMFTYEFLSTAMQLNILKIILRNHHTRYHHSDPYVKY